MDVHPIYFKRYNYLRKVYPEIIADHAAGLYIDVFPL